MLNLSLSLGEWNSEEIILLLPKPWGRGDLCYGLEESRKGSLKIWWMACLSSIRKAHLRVTLSVTRGWLANQSPLPPFPDRMWQSPLSTHFLLLSKTIAGWWGRSFLSRKQQNSFPVQEYSENVFFVTEFTILQGMEVSLTGLSYPRASLQPLGWLGIKQAVQKLSGMMVVYKQTLASSL